MKSVFAFVFSVIVSGSAFARGAPPVFKPAKFDLLSLVGAYRLVGCDDKKFESFTALQRVQVVKVAALNPMVYVSTFPGDAFDYLYLGDFEDAGGKPVTESSSSDGFASRRVTRSYTTTSGAAHETSFKIRDRRGEQNSYRVDTLNAIPAGLLKFQTSSGPSRNNFKVGISCTFKRI